MLMYYMRQRVFYLLVDMAFICILYILYIVVVIWIKYVVLPTIFSSTYTIHCGKIYRKLQNVVSFHQTTLHTVHTNIIYKIGHYKK